MFIHEQTTQVPIARVITNLERRMATNREDVDLVYQLARIHSMAYATNVQNVAVTVQGENASFGYPGPDIGVPRAVSSRTTKADREQAFQHLTNAIAYYQKAAKLVVKGTNAIAHQWLSLPIHLGLAWTIEQSGRKEEAVQAYRNALRLAWRQEVDPEIPMREQLKWSWDQLRVGKNPLTSPQHVKYLGPGPSFSEEIIRYLLLALDQKRDAKEIAQLQADQKVLRSMGRAVTPLLVPLRGGVSFEQLIDPSVGVPFDLDGSGHLRRWGWLTTNAAWLVYDRQGKGQITSGLQMFGSVTFWIFWRDGYQALAALDDNDDGQISSAELNGISLWCDSNSNGVSEKGEVRPVSDYAITSISCRGQSHSTGIPFSPQGVTFRDGTFRPTFDWMAPMHADADVDRVNDPSLTQKSLSCTNSLAESRNERNIATR